MILFASLCLAVPTMGQTRCVQIAGGNHEAEPLGRTLTGPHPAGWPPDNYTYQPEYISEMVDELRHAMKLIDSGEELEALRPIVPPTKYFACSATSGKNLKSCLHQPGTQKNTSVHWHPEAIRKGRLQESPGSWITPRWPQIAKERDSYEMIRLCTNYACNRADALRAEVENIKVAGG